MATGERGPIVPAPSRWVGRPILRLPDGRFRVQDNHRRRKVDNERPESAGIRAESSHIKPPTSGFNSVDPAPALAARETPAALHRLLLDIEQPMFERYRALFSLRDMNTDESARILGDGMVRDRSALLRHECAYVLGQIQREAAIPFLLQALRHDPSYMVRHEAAEALGAIGTDEVIPPLRAAMAEDESADVRESCELALAHIRYLRDSIRL